MICIEIEQTGETRRIDRPIWVRRLGNGTVAACHRPQAEGVSDGAETWSLGALEGYPAAKLITLMEHREPDAQDDDPELTAEEALNILLGGTA